MVDQGRVPAFELHIRPMLRLLDREHMAKVHGSLDLWDLDAVWQQRAEILERVSATETTTMPPERYGGPWPAEWVNLFERWLATGSDTEPGHHLLLAKPDGEYRVQSLGGDKRRLTVAATAPTEECRLWFDCTSITPGQREYTLYLEPAFPAQPPNPKHLQALEIFLKDDATLLVIHDADGRHELPLT
jgi:hypothetical protein